MKVPNSNVASLVGKKSLQQNNNNNSTINFPPGKRNTGKDLFIDLDCSNFRKLDYFCLFDSRGSTIQGKEGMSFGWQLSKYFRDNNNSYILACRPLDITVFFSLINFVVANQISAKTLITNVGFVDFTPKKKDIINDIVLQKENLFGGNRFELHEMGLFRLSNSSKEMLYVLDFKECLPIFSKILEERFDKVFFLETPEFSVDQPFPRNRPIAFFSQLKATNSFLNEIAKTNKSFHIIPSPKIPQDYLSFSTDGVHYTNKAHKVWFLQILKSLNNVA